MAQNIEQLISSCALCSEVKPLRQSHIIPAFVFRWLKNTSATGYLRNLKKPNVRAQDGWKVPLLCDCCEGVFSRDEVKFKEKIFYHYVNEELSEEGIATGKIARFEYREWLLRFVISLHWRLISVQEDRSYLPQNLFDLLCATKDIWRDFLLSKRNDTGENQTHLFFLQNIAVYPGYIPKYINDMVNFYVLRAVDYTLVSRESREFGIYSKIGPIAFYTSLKPGLLKNTPDSKLGMNGKIRTVQALRNKSINRFIFVDRPNQELPKLEFSEIQQEVIRKAYMRDKQRVDNSKTMRAHEADMIIRKLKNLQESTDEFHL